MTSSAQEPIRILPAKIVPMSEDEFEEITDLLADLVLDMIKRDQYER